MRIKRGDKREELLGITYVIPAAASQQLSLREKVERYKREKKGT
jgi:hypothetical protein